MPEGEAVRPSVSKRWECKVCGKRRGSHTVDAEHSRHSWQPVERVYWAADEVLEALKYGRFPGAAGHLLRRFSEEGAS